MDTNHLRQKRLAAARVGKRVLDLTPFRKILGEDIPNFPLNKLGRYRLQQRLQYKFGAGYKNVDQAAKLLALFDREVKLNDMGV